ncbi:MAG: beta-mannosidase, partial [Muribaculum sp.]|nr:beta-mannosidase [Muribaculum sp.]
MFLSSVVSAYGQIDSTGRSLDEIERISFRAGISPADLSGIEMKNVSPKTIKNFKSSGEISLSGTWLLAEGLDSIGEEAIIAKVPGSVHSALFDAGLIPDPTIGMNDSIAEKQSYKNWWYRRKFHYDKNWDKVMLSFDGVANKCTVYLNGKKLGSHEGMMGGPDYLLGDELKNGENELLVYLEGIPNPVPGPGANPSWVNTVVANCVYGWHYVKIPSLGIWADVRLKEVPKVAIQHPFIFTRNLDGSMRLVVNIPDEHPAAMISLNVRPKNFDGKQHAYRCDVSGLKGDVALDFKIDDPRLWWPNGVGEQPLYTATVTYDAGNGLHDVKTLNFGVRTIEMQPVGGEERKDVYNWKFVVNGRPICIKGANWCLIDYMLDLSPEHYSRFLGAAKEQNLNLLRAWGGGLVETDTFYDMCDEMGLMVMQEWPTAWNSHLSQNFDILKETIDRNTYRIRSHPSLVMWAGGNESSDPF